MLENVKPGEKIRALQYNDLLAGIAGPAAASNEIPFTQTKNGILFNGGCTLQQTKASAKFNSLLAVSYSTGTIDEDFAGYDDDDPENLFDGIWYLNAYFSKLNLYFYHGQFFVLSILTFLIDPTTEEDDFKLLWLLKGARLEPNGSTPLCKVDEQAALGVFQVTKCTSYTNPMLGATVAVVGNWKKLDDNLSEGWNVYDAAANNSNMQKLVAQLRAKCPFLALITEIRFLALYTMYDNYDELEDEALDFPPVAYNVGLQHIESLPDAAQGHFELSAAELSSIEFTPSLNFGFRADTPTWGYSLYNFGRYDSDKLSTVYDPSVHKYVTEVSAYDILLRHKHPHSLSGSNNNNYLGRAEAVLEYISLADMKDFLGNPDVDTQKTGGELRSIDWNISANNKYLQLYNFDDPDVSDNLIVNLVYGGTRYAHRDNGGTGEYPPDNLQFVVRDSAGNVEVQYDTLAVQAPPIYASDVRDLCSVISGMVVHECSCDLRPLSAALDDLSSQLSNYWKCGGTYDDNCYGESIGDSSQVLAIDIDNGGLWYGSSQTLDWHACELYDLNGASGPGNICLNWHDRLAYNLNGNATIDWKYGKLYESTGSVDTVDWENCFLKNPADGANAVDWSSRILNDANTYSSVEWGNRYLMDSAGGRAVDWENKQLVGNWTVMYGELAVEGTATFKIGNTTLTEAQLQQLLALLNTP